MSKINSLLMPFEIGDLFFTTNNTNPSNRFGGTWELYAKGKTIVGIDPDDTDFDSIGKTGGSKELQAHTHKTTVNHVGTSQNFDRSIALYNATDLPYALYTAEGEAEIYPTGTTGTGNSGNLQPYIVSYIWIKTA